MAALQSTPPLDTCHVQPSARICIGAGTWHFQPFIRMTMGLVCYPHLPCLDSVANVLDKILNHVSRAIITHTTKSMLNRMLLGHFRRPATTCPAPPAGRKDKDDGKSSLQQSLTAACKIMITLPPSKHHHDKPKSLPTIKGDKDPDTIKSPRTVKKKVSNS